MDLIDPNTLAPESISPKGAGLAQEYQSTAFPHDWTESAGTLGNSGEIDLPAPTAGKKRLWLLIQNQSATTITVKYEARLANGFIQSFVSVLLAPGASAGSQGSSDERGFSAFLPQGIIKIVGAANAQVAVAEVVE